MTKLRILVLISTLLVISTFGTLAFIYAKGYRFDFKKNKITPNGLLVLKSDPDGAEIFINENLKGATNSNFSLEPSTYDVSIRKENYLTWNKRLKIEKEVVTQATAHLFKVAPSLTAITFANVQNPNLSPDYSKISYIVNPDNNQANNNFGLWIIEMINLPLGFSRQPRKITNANLTGANLIWSPNSRQIFVDKGNSSFILNIGDFIPEKQLTNISARKQKIFEEWQKEKTKQLDSKLAKLPSELQDILKRKASAIVFSPDEDMVLYTASGSAEIKPELIKPIPGASTQKEERNIKQGKTYIYDIKEDRNFLITEDEVNLNGWIDYNKIQNNLNLKTISWFPTSRHIILAEEEKIIIMDYDGTNRQVVYSGNYLFPYVFPTISFDRLIILTNLGASSTPTNLYSLGIK